MGPLPTFWSLWSVLELSWRLWVCHLACWCITVSVYWGSRFSGSWLVHHLGPIWFKSVYVMSSGYVILSKVVSCPLPSCFPGRVRTLSKDCVSREGVWCVLCGWGRGLEGMLSRGLERPGQAWTCRQDEEFHIIKHREPLNDFKPWLSPICVSKSLLLLQKTLTSLVVKYLG